MKKILLFAALLGFAVACGGNEKKEEPKAEEAQVEAPATEEPQAEEPQVEATTTSEPNVVENKSAINTDLPSITATEFEKKSELTVSDKKVAVGAAQVAEKETTKAGNEGVKIEVKEFEKKSNLSVGGTAAAGAVAM